MPRAALMGTVVTVVLTGVLGAFASATDVAQRVRHGGAAAIASTATAVSESQRPSPTPAETASPSATTAPIGIVVTGVADHWGPARAGYTVKDELLQVKDSDMSVAAKDLTATIDWGDRSSASTVRGTLGFDPLSSGFISMLDGSYALSAAHEFSTAGSFTAVVTVADASGNAVSQTVHILVYAD